MTEEIKNRIEAIRHGEVPKGYRGTRAGYMPNEWDQEIRAKDVFKNYTNKRHGGNYEVLSATQEKGIIPRSEVDIDIKYDESSVNSYKKVDSGDFVISLRSFQGGIEYSEYEGLVSPAYTVLKNKLPIDAGYYKAYFKTSDFIKRLNGAVYGIRDGKQIGFEDFGDLAIHYPPLPEQQKIAEILATCDKVIEVKRGKIAELQKMKQAFMRKMFPQNGCSVPELRFPGFSGDWEQRKLGEVFSSLQNNTLSKDELSSEQGTALNVHYGDVLVKFGEYLDVKKESIPFVVDRVIVAKFKKSYLQNGDVIFADTAEDETVGKCCEMAGLTDEVVISGLHTIPYRPLIRFASGFLGYYLNSDSYRRQLLPLMQGIKVTSISKSAMQNTNIHFPKEEAEQAKISAYFRLLDNLITLHQRELEEQEKNKKALMQLLLTGLVRVNV